MYKKRHARFVQQRLANDRAGRKTTKRTLEAEANNLDWVLFYKAVLNENQASGKIISNPNPCASIPCAL